MNRRRLVEIAVALAVLVLLVAVFLVRPTHRVPPPPPPQLFVRVAGAPPDFTSDAYDAYVARSPDGRRIAVLYPREFEERSDLYLMTGPGEGTHWVLADSLRAQNTPKAVGWLDDGMLWVTVGYVYGTVSPGGDLFLLDPESGRGSLLWAADQDTTGRTQAVAARAAAGGGLSVELKVFDPAMDNPHDSTATVPPTVLDAARKSLSDRTLTAARSG
jgi:hypothetical protein